MTRAPLSMFLLLVALPALAAQPKKIPEDHVQGEQLFTRSCWQCHGETNAGDGPAAEYLVDDVPDLRKQITPKRHGELVPLIMNGSTTHPAFSSEIDDNKARRILIYMERMDREGVKKDEKGSKDAERGNDKNAAVKKDDKKSEEKAEEEEKTD